MSSFCADAARLVFGASQAPTGASSEEEDASCQPSILLLTQNIGGLNAWVGEGDASAASSLPTSLTTRVVDKGDANAVVEPPLLSQVQQDTLEFIAHLRSWLHRVAHFTSSSHIQECSTKGNAGKEVDYAKILSSYTSQCTPPQLDVIVIHFQEVGGKHMHRGFNDFFANALAQHLLPEAGWSSGLCMDRDDSNDRFTALATVVFLSPRMCPISSMLSFPHHTYIPVQDDPCSYGSSPRNVFHAARFTRLPRSRKGFLVVSLRLGTTVVHTCNVHLPHDADNTVAFAQSPSAYAKSRTDSFLEAVAECLAVTSPDEPIFFFGDMNFRLDCKALAAYFSETEQVAIRPLKTELRCPDVVWRRFAQPSVQATLRQRFDREPRALMDGVAAQSGMELAEMPVTFAPTYSRCPRDLPSALAACDAINDKQSAGSQEAVAQAAQNDRGSGAAAEHAAQAHEDEGAEGSEELEAADKLSSALFATRGRAYNCSRVPAWCDRVLFNPAALELLLGACGRVMFDEVNTTAAVNTVASPVAAGAGAMAGGTSAAGTTPSMMLSQVEAALQSKRYLYDAVSLAHTDHDGVFLLF